MTSIRFDRDADHIVTLTLDQPGQSTNVMNEAFRADFPAVLDRLEAELDGVKGVIITSAKKSFFAGGDLNALLALRPDQAEEAFARAQQTKKTLRRLELLGVPVVAAINGAALGGGFEICLACHARFCLDDRSIQLGLPEVTLGLLPGAGGVIRMVRYLGLESAMPYLTDGKQFDPAEAQKIGLVNGREPTIEALLQAARAWIAANPKPVQPWDAKSYAIPGSNAAYKAAPLFLRTAPVLLLKKTRGRYPAPERIMRAAFEGASVDFDTACRIESRHFAALATGSVAKNMISTLFFQMKDISSGVMRPADVPERRFTKVGVLGAGMMGAGIAHANAVRSIDCVLKDVSDEKAEKGKDYTRKLLAKRIERGGLSQQQADKILDRIQATGNVGALKGCDLIIEAVFENRDLKAGVVREAESMMDDGGITASNTSTLPITGLAEASAHPDRFIGLHFFSPVDKMPLVEIITGEKTSRATLAAALDYVRQIGKTPIVVRDSRGFFTSRVFGTYIREGAEMVGEGIPAGLIESVTLNAGIPAGPLTVLDQVSLKLTHSARQQAIRDAEATGTTPAPGAGYGVIARMVEEFGREGRATGAGFYDYVKDGSKEPWPGLVAHFGDKGKNMPTQDIEDRLLYIQALEAIRIYEEGVIDSVGQANVGSILGIGFPRWTGGVLQYVNMVGLDAFTARAEELSLRYGERYAPPKLLKHKAKAGEIFTD